MKNLLWLASYPKSGNTWMRVFLANLQISNNEPVDINALEDYWAGSRNLFDHFSGLESSLLTDAETLHFRHIVYECLNVSVKKITLIKTHAPYHCNSEGADLFPASVSQGVIYIVRNPLDLVASLANHHSLTLDESISLLSNKEYALSANTNRTGKPGKELFEPISSWSRNVASWVDKCKFPLLVVRYEDLVFQPFETFSQAAHFSKLSEDPAQIRKAMSFSSFEKLQNQEKIKGFREKPTNMKRFFRNGKVGSWRQELSSAQAKQVIQDNRAMMQKFGYLTEDNLPVY